jgi:glycosyltransferase involved in cell wall biosynthesis
MLRVLLTYSNFKWTGPADHALNLAAWLGRRQDVLPLFTCGERRGHPNHIRQKARQRGLETVPGMFLDKHLNWRIVPDLLALRRLVRREGIGVIHSHQENDSLTAVLAGYGRRLVRTCYDGDPPPMTPRRRFAWGKTACILTASARVKASLAEAFPGKPVAQVDIPVDSRRFRPMPKNAALCREFGLAPGEVVAGIVARVQKHRHFATLLEALCAVVREVPDYKFLVVGRGTHIDAVARTPARRLGLEKNLIFTGYRGEDYLDVLNLLDYKVFLQPGSDGACRAVREALACGVPVIASRRGILPELIRDGQTGLLVNGDAHGLAAAMLALHRRDEFRNRCARAARAYAETVLDPQRYVEKVIACYRRVAPPDERPTDGRTETPKGARPEKTRGGPGGIP